MLVEQVSTNFTFVSGAVKTYLSPVETHCNNINYYIPDENNETRDFTDDAWTRLRKYMQLSHILKINFSQHYLAKLKTKVLF